TVLAEPGEQVEWPDTKFVIKPTVGAGSRGAQRFPAGTTRHADEHLAALHARGTGALIQPYQSTVDRHGETAVVFIAGELSHTYVKGPLLVPGSWLDSSGLFATETLMPVEASPEVLRFADKALDVAADVLSMDRAEFLYARVDVVRSDAGEPLLLELELTEPSLGFAFGGRQAADRLAQAAREIALSGRLCRDRRARLGGRGLGPVGLRNRATVTRGAPQRGGADDHECGTQHVQRDQLLRHAQFVLRRPEHALGHGSQPQQRV